MTLQVSTEGPSPSSYQWWKDGEQIGSETHPYCHGADTPILHISPVESGCGGVYKCVVSHTAVSNSANITLGMKFYLLLINPWCMHEGYRSCFVCVSVCQLGHSKSIVSHPPLISARM